MLRERRKIGYLPSKHLICFGFCSACEDSFRHALGVTVSFLPRADGWCIMLCPFCSCGGAGAVLCPAAFHGMGWGAQGRACCWHWGSFPSEMLQSRVFSCMPVSKWDLTSVGDFSFPLGEEERCALKPPGSPRALGSPLPAPGAAPICWCVWIAYLQVSSVLLRSGIALAVPALPVGFSKCFSMLLKALGGEEGGRPNKCDSCLWGSTQELPWGLCGSLPLLWLGPGWTKAGCNPAVGTECAEPQCLLAPCWVQYRPLPTADCWFFIFSLNSFIQSFLPTEDSGIF